MGTFSFGLLLLLPFISFLFHRILNTFRKFRTAPATGTALTAIGLSILAVLTGITFLEWKSPSFFTSLFYGIITTPLLGHLYFQIFNLSETARRICLLVTLKKSGVLAIDGSYAPDCLVSIRLQRLRALNQVHFSEGKYSSRFGALTFAAVALRAIERFMYPRRSQNR